MPPADYEDFYNLVKAMANTWSSAMGSQRYLRGTGKFGVRFSEAHAHTHTQKEGRAIDKAEGLPAAADFAF